MDFCVVEAQKRVDEVWGRNECGGWEAYGQVDGMVIKDVLKPVNYFSIFIMDSNCSSFLT